MFRSKWTIMMRKSWVRCDMWSFSFGGLLGSFLFSATAVQAATTHFICDDWQGPDWWTGEHKIFEGTLFSGKKTDKGYVIRNKQGTKIELIYLGEYNRANYKLYSGINPRHSTTSYNIVGAYTVWSGEAASELLVDYDFQITRLKAGSGGNDTTKCKFE